MRSGATWLTAVLTASSVVLVAAGTAATAAGGERDAVKGAIRDLYAKIKSLEANGGHGDHGGAGGGGGELTVTRLDDVTSSKAKYVADVLRRMVDIGGCVEFSRSAAAVTVDDKVSPEPRNNGPAAHEDGGGGGGGGCADAERNGKDDRLTALVDRLLETCLDIVLAKDAADAAANGRQTASRVYIDALERRFVDVFERLKKSHGLTSDVTAAVDADDGQRRIVASVPPTRIGGFFKFPLFYRQRITATFANADVR